MEMKRMLTFFLLAVMALSLGACACKKKKKLQAAECYPVSGKVCYPAPPK